MPRQKRELKPNFCYHVTTRCNSREFRLIRRECKEVLLFVLKKAIEKFNFKLYGLCIMSNHVHYLIEPKEPEDLPKIMHWLNWYSAMCFNRMLNRSGHFWEKRYHSTGFENTDYRRALNTLRYIHANPKTAKMQVGFFYDFSNYGTHERLEDDGITEWHPAFLSLGESLDDCAKEYKGFCKKYKPKAKSEKRYFWGSQMLPKLTSKKKKKKKKTKKEVASEKDQVTEQQKEPWEIPSDEVREVSQKFILANCYDKKFVAEFFNSETKIYA